MSRAYISRQWTSVTEHIRSVQASLVWRAKQRIRSWGRSIRKYARRYWYEKD